ncbi:hypothetical protein [Deinococcus marmoris]|uniref:Uncharacterized protein n=1 Tax=Deinococcus marmoris TaxID=249408 RepID=A0A1U7P4U4_9DEIO|nr:hypothetical protein [Deinococcus marmoris]OLV20178.1 hypothetical protein BOO71_0000562 [Deinococcus marmoris]
MDARLRMGEHARGDDLLFPARQTTDTADVRPTFTAQRASTAQVKAQAKTRRKAKKEARKKQRR